MLTTTADRLCQSSASFKLWDVRHGEVRLALPIARQGADLLVFLCLRGEVQPHYTRYPLVEIEVAGREVL